MDRSYIHWSIPDSSGAGDDARNVRSRLEQTRAILVGMSRMLSGIIMELVSAEPDLTIVGEVEESDSALPTIDRSKADVVIASLEGSVRANVVSLLRERPRLRVLAISDDGAASSLYELLPCEQLLGEISPQRLLAAIRGRFPEGSMDDPNLFVETNRAAHKQKGT